MLTNEEVMKLDNDINIIPLISDTMGKNIFKKNIELTKVFLKDILDLEEVNDIEFIDTELEVEKAKNYKFITDLGLLVNKNLIVNIELCRDYYNKHKERFLAYVCKLVTYDIKKGVDVKKEMKRVKQIIFVCKERNEKMKLKDLGLVK